ncbi:transcription factor Spn1p [Monosporozyma unispora]|nr:Transcription factor iws1 [Kazachstania unispora]
MEVTENTVDNNVPNKEQSPVMNETTNTTTSTTSATNNNEIDPAFIENVSTTATAADSGDEVANIASAAVAAASVPDQPGQPDENANLSTRQRRRIDDSDDDETVDAALDENVMRESKDVYSDDGNEIDNKPISSRQVLEEKLDMLLKKPKVKRSRRDEDDLEQYLDEKILRLKDEMNIAAQLDIETLNKRIETGDTSLIAIQKVKLLPKVEQTLSKANLADTILDNNLLQSVRIWLEPLPDGSLPSFEIQKSLFAAINDLPIKTEHLKESGLGRVMIFYTKSKRVEPSLARLAEKLIAEWTRPVIGASDNYRDLRITQLEFDSEKLRKKNVLDSAKRKKRKGTPNGESESREGSTPQSLYEQAAARRGRAAAPAQTTTDYRFAPVSNVIPMNTDARTTGVGSTLNNSDLYKRLNSRLHKKK